MKHFIIGTDHSESPQRSTLVMGPECDDDVVRRAFYAARAASVHNDGSRVWELWTRTGRVEVSIATKHHIKKGPTK